MHLLRSQRSWSILNPSWSWKRIHIHVQLCVSWHCGHCEELELDRQTEVNGIHGKLRQSTSQFKGSDNLQNKSHANQLTIKAIIFFISFTMHTARAGQYVPLFMAKHKEQKGLQKITKDEMQQDKRKTNKHKNTAKGNKFTTMSWTNDRFCLGGCCIFLSHTSVMARAKEKW